MGAFARGEVVITPFPFSDLSGAKRRPALVVATLTGADIILCQITSQPADSYATPLLDTDFSSGGIRQLSHIRPNRLFTADARIIHSTAGVITDAKMQEVTAKLIQILSQ